MQINLGGRLNSASCWRASCRRTRVQVETATEQLGFGSLEDAWRRRSKESAYKLYKVNTDHARILLTRLEEGPITPSHPSRLPAAPLR